jgi:hypothetical protein
VVSSGGGKGKGRETRGGKERPITLIKKNETIPHTFMIHPLANIPPPHHPPVRTPSARLSVGSMSRQSLLFSGRGSVQPFVEALNHSPTVLPRNGDIFENPRGPDREMVEENTVIERPVWQSFIVMLMVHYPLMGKEIYEAMELGAIPPKRIVLSSEGVEFLNHFIQFWYEGGVEIVTIEVEEGGDGDMLAVQDVQYGVPYRPVTGLNVIVTPTVQRTLIPRDRVILKEKERFSKDEGLNGIGRYIRVCVAEVLVPMRNRDRMGGKGGGRDHAERGKGGKRGIGVLSWLAGV